MNLLVLLLLVPMLGVVVCAFVSGRMARQMALFASLVTLFVALLAAMRFFTAAPEAMENLGYFGGALPVVGFSIRLGVDSISMWLILLTAGLQPLAIAASFGSIRERQQEYYAWMLALLTAMLGVFVARDALLFYVFFELTLIPMFFIIGIWGGPDRRWAASKFFLFTFAGSVFMLAALIYVGVKAGSFDIDAIVRHAQTGLTISERRWVLLGFLAGFAVKVPLFPVHTWLPLAHTEAPTAGSVILAGVLLKLGTYGLLRLAVPIGLIAPEGAVPFPTLLWWLGILCVIGIIYGALVAWVQQDIKKLVAYSSVSHLGFCVLGLIALNDIGIQGSVLYMINHGINTGALFLCIGMIYDRYHTRDINELSGLARRMPILACFLVLFCLASIGLPGTNGFVSEFLTILGAFTSVHLGPVFAALAATGIILGAVYILHMLARVIWGPLKTPALDDAHGHAGETSGAAGHHHATVPGDINGREIAILTPLAIAVIALGVWPGLVTNVIEAPVSQLLTAAVAPIIPRTGATTQPAIVPAILPDQGPRPAPAAPTTTPILPLAAPPEIPQSQPAPPTTQPTTLPTTAPATLPSTAPAPELGPDPDAQPSPPESLAEPTLILEFERSEQDAADAVEPAPPAATQPTPAATEPAGAPTESSVPPTELPNPAPEPAIPSTEPATAPTEPSLILQFELDVGPDTPPIEPPAEQGSGRPES